MSGGVTAFADEDAVRAATLQQELDRLDGDLLRLVKQRTAVGREVAEVRAALGGTRFALAEEVAVVRRFAQLGPPGRELAALLVRMSR
jgi:monofunctional chorismate mutase